MKVCFWLATAVFLASFCLGMSTPPEAAARMLEQLRLLVGPMKAASPVGLLAIIFLNNAIKTLAVVLLGVVFGFPSLFLLVSNGYILGVVAVAAAPASGLGMVIASLAPHGIIEVPIMLLGTALGLGVGWESLKWAIGRESHVRDRLRHGLAVYLRWIVLGLLVAAAIEVFVTPQVVRLISG